MYNVPCNPLHGTDATPLIPLFCCWLLLSVPSCFCCCLSQLSRLRLPVCYFIAVYDCMGISLAAGLYQEWTGCIAHILGKTSRRPKEFVQIWVLINMHASSTGG